MNRVLGAKKSMLSVFLLLVVLGASGCALFGSPNRNTYDESAVEATLQALAEAGVKEDIDAVSKHLADTIQITVDNAAPALSPLSQSSTIEQLNAIWSDGTTNRFDLNITDIQVQGDTANVGGSVFLDYFDASTNTRYTCTFTGEAVLVNEDGRWVVTQVVVTDQNCTTGDGEPGPGDEEPDPGDEEPDPGDHNPEMHQYFFDEGLYLTLGFKGEQVQAVQESLALLGHYTGLIDGDYGPYTEAAVRSFQEAQGLYVDGEFGPATRAALDAALEAHGGYFQVGQAAGAFAGPTTLTESVLGAGTDVETPVYIYESPNPGPTLLFVGCIHGNEQSGHIALTEAIEHGITLSRGRVVIVPQFNANGCAEDERTYDGVDFNRLFPAGEDLSGDDPIDLLAQEMWELVTSQPNLAFVVDFHDGFVNSLGNTLIHTEQSEAGNVAETIADQLNEIRPSGAVGPSWRAFTEPISGSLTRKVGRDLDIPAMEVELSGRSVHDPLQLRKEYAWTIIRMLGREYDMTIGFSSIEL